jgi:hypothetical protein
MRARGSDGRSVVASFHRAAGDQLQTVQTYHRLSVELKGGCWLA